MELNSVAIALPEGCNLIFSQTHFIKTVEDLHKVLVGIIAHVKFGIAFCEASKPCLIRASGNDSALQEAAIQHAKAIALGGNNEKL